MVIVAVDICREDLQELTEVLLEAHEAARVLQRLIHPKKNNPKIAFDMPKRI